ncbi:MAG: hypothetical protein Q4F31_03015 [Eubacteriales bacterium]|nr:hypothetical protein [Eubacteriales bacterium]
MTEGDPKRESPDKTPLPTQIPVETPMPAINSEPEMTPDRKEKKIPEVNAYNDGVSLGTVRYVSQLNEPENNGWGKYAWKAGMECTTACISMSLSYIGIDASPEEILDYSSQTVLASTYGIDEITASDLTSIKLPAKDAFVKLMEMVERYESAEENSMSPPLLYFSGNGHYHAFIVIGKGEDDQYLTTDPALSGIHIVSISEQGEITTEEEGYLERYTNNGASPAVINSIAQWQIKE